jgi:hypothetical protein
VSRRRTRSCRSRALQVSRGGSPGSRVCSDGVREGGRNGGMEGGREGGREEVREGVREGGRSGFCLVRC